MKKLSCILIVVLSISLFVGCTGKAEKENQIVIWANYSEEEESKLQELCDKWGSENNKNVKLVASSVNEVEYNAVKEAKYDSPDIIWGISTEKTGWLKENNCVEELPSDIDVVENYISNDIVENASIDGVRYGVPIYVETLGLFYNKDLVSEVPGTIEELLEVSKEKGLSFNIANGYFSYGFISACGGYVFKNNNGSFDKNDIGLDNEGAIKGYKLLSDICNKYKLGIEDNTDDCAEACFSMGKSAFYIGEQKKVKNFIKGKINFGITTIPSINGESFKPFKEVKMAFVNPNSAEKEESYELLKYLIENSGDSLINANKIPAIKSYVESETFKSNNYLQGFYKQLETSEVTPNIYELQAYWGTMDRNLQLLILGDSTPEECGKNVKKDMEELMKDF